MVEGMHFGGGVPMMEMNTGAEPADVPAGEITQRSLSIEQVANGVVVTETAYHTTRGHGSKRWAFTDSGALLHFLSEWALENMTSAEAPF
ncbi:MAG: hypothetical protein NXI30_04365 [bacterium]|nr:hypothetical protein [bacterium]